jgi:hypothetical protein
MAEQQPRSMVIVVTRNADDDRTSVAFNIANDAYVQSGHGHHGHGDFGISLSYRRYRGQGYGYYGAGYGVSWYLLLALWGCSDAHWSTYAKGWSAPHPVADGHPVLRNARRFRYTTRSPTPPTAISTIGRMRATWNG